MAKATSQTKSKLKSNKASLRLVSSKNEKTIGFLNLTDEFTQKVLGVPVNKVTADMLEDIKIESIVDRANLVITDHTVEKEIDPEEY